MVRDRDAVDRIYSWSVSDPRIMGEASDIVLVGNEHYFYYRARVRAYPEASDPRMRLFRRIIFFTASMDARLGCFDVVFVYDDGGLF